MAYGLILKSTMGMTGFSDTTRKRSFLRLVAVVDILQQPLKSL